MAYEIGPLRESELDALSRFLVAGFHAPADAPFAAPDVLRWKFLTPRGEPGELVPRSLVARDESGAIVGHVGWVSTTWRVDAPGEPHRTYSGVHMIDWLGSPAHRGVGSALMRRVNAVADIPYGFGGSHAGRSVLKGAGFEPWPAVPVYQCVLRPSHAIREASGAWWKRLARAARDSLKLTLDPKRNLRFTAEWQFRRIARFSPEVDSERASLSAPLISSAPSLAMLNALLGFPRGRLSAWQLEHRTPADNQELHPIWVLLSVTERGALRVGKIVDLIARPRLPLYWYTGYCFALEELARQGAHVAYACASTQWESQAMVQAGFQKAFDLELSIRDRKGLLPRGVPVHVSFLEADYAYLP